MVVGFKTWKQTLTVMQRKAAYIRPFPKSCASYKQRAALYLDLIDLIIWNGVIYPPNDGTVQVNNTSKQLNREQKGKSEIHENCYTREPLPRLLERLAEELIDLGDGILARRRSRRSLLLRRERGRLVLVVGEVRRGRRAARGEDESAHGPVDVGSLRRVRRRRGCGVVGGLHGCRTAGVIRS
jgi:hypothetical protein